MNEQSPYNANPELSAMKLDVADRSYNLRIKSMMITGATMVGGVILGGLLTAAFPQLGMLGLMGGLAGGLMAGGTIADMVTMKERTKLKIDEEMVASYMSGKNYWGEGYREEVAEKGYGFGGQPQHGGLPHPSRGGRHI